MVRSIAAMTDLPPLIDEEKVEAFLDAHGLGTGPVVATRIGDGGGSNFTFLIERGKETFVLRRPPRPPLPPTAHDMVREAGLQNAIRAAGFARLADILAVCDDENVLGVPFYVMRYIDGHVITSELPPGLETEEARNALGLDLVDTLVEIHSADVSHDGARGVRAPGQLHGAPGAPLQAALGDQQDPRPAAGRAGRHVARRQPAGAAARRPSCTATTASGT